MKAQKTALNKQQDKLAEDYEADTIRQTAEDYDNFQLLLTSLETDLKRLSGLAPGDKDKLKESELIPKYLPACDEYLCQGLSYRNLVLTEVIIMLLDVGRIPDAMDLVWTAMEQKQPMPQRFKKANLPTFVAEKVYDWTNIQLAKDKDFEPEFTKTFETMEDDGWKVPREMIARFHKLSGDISEKNDDVQTALDHFIRAMEIDPNGAQCKTRIDKIKKKMAKDQA